MGVGAGKDGGLDVPLLDGRVVAAAVLGVLQVAEVEAGLGLHLLVLVHVPGLRVGGAGGGAVLAVGLRLDLLVVGFRHQLGWGEKIALS